MGTWPNFKKAASSSPPRYKAIITQMRQRLLPHDNLSVWGLAQVMVEEGLIPKDPTSVIWELRQRKLAWGEPYTVIEIYELEESDGYW
jgi:hypothetical protein